MKGEFIPLERCPTRLIVDVSENQKVARDDEIPILMPNDTSMMPNFSPRTIICIPPVNRTESRAIQGVTDFKTVSTNAKGRSAPLELLPIVVTVVSECSKSTLATMPLSIPPPAAFRQTTDTSEIQVELEHDVPANRTETVADRYEK
jgi:hypothetical protein